MGDPDQDVEVEILRRVRGRVALAGPGSTIHMGRGYEILRSDDEGETWRRITAMPRSPLRAVVERSRMASRLLRHELRALNRLADGTYVATNRQGVFFGREGDASMQPSAVETEGLPLLPPMRITVGPDDSVLWGEYVGNRVKRKIRLFRSTDGARSHQMIQQFDSPGEVDHIHNIVWDEARGHYWVLAGDIGPHPGIGKLSPDGERFEWFVKGEQVYRVVEVFDFGDRFVYATDSEVEHNHLVAFDKETGAVERIRDLEGSCIYACRFGDLYALTTSVEPSEVNATNRATLWLSSDGTSWKRAFRGTKDAYNAKYFQFGSIVLPTGATTTNTLYFSGQALQGIDGQTLVARLKSR